MPLIFNGKVVAGEQRPVLDELNENSDFLVSSKAIAKYIKQMIQENMENLEKKYTPVYAETEDFINYTVNIPGLKLENGTEITIIPRETCVVESGKYAWLKLNNEKNYKIAPISAVSNNTVVAPLYKDYIKSEAPLKLIFNARMNAWMSPSVVIVREQDLA